MKIFALLAAAAQAKGKEDCCEFVKIAAYESTTKIYDGMYRTET